MKVKFELMDISEQGPIIQIIGLDDGGQLLGHYLKTKGIVGVDFDVIRDDADLNIYLVDSESLPNYLAEIQTHSDHCRLNYLILINQESSQVLEVAERKKNLKSVDLHLSLPAANNDITLARQNEEAYQFISGITDLLTGTGIVAVDFADIIATTAQGGSALNLYSGSYSGQQRIQKALDHLFVHYESRDSPLLRPKAIVINIYSGLDLDLEEFERVNKAFNAYFNDNDVTIHVGSTITKKLKDSIAISAIFCGIQSDTKKHIND